MKNITEPLPFQPESIEAMRARWHQATATVYYRELVDAGRQGPPGALRQHVFDFPDGIRLIVTMDNEDDMTSLHLSFGIHATFHSIWIPKGQENFLRHCRALVESFQVAGIITNPIEETQITNRAYHFWFKA